MSYHSCKVNSLRNYLGTKPSNAIVAKVMQQKISPLDLLLRRFLLNESVEL